jgi:Holliday junction DNA helicase RuvA
MIAYVNGKLAAANPTGVVVDCGGIGYAVTIPVSSYDKLPAVGNDVKLLTYHHVNAQDGTQQLFGFATAAERDMFLLLISIAGIGPKLACNILSSASVTALRAAIAAGDTKTLSSLRGIGKKTADRLIVELRDKVGEPTAAPATPSSPHVADAALALVSLGYKQSDATRAAAAAAEKLGHEAPIEELVRVALRSV